MMFSCARASMLIRLDRVPQLAMSLAQAAWPVLARHHLAQVRNSDLRARAIMVEQLVTHVRPARVSILLRSDGLVALASFGRRLDSSFAVVIALKPIIGVLFWT